MPEYSFSDRALFDMFRRECDRLNWPWFHDGDWDLNFFGIRNPNRTANSFDDILGCGLLVRGQPVVHLWPGTTDPGRYWLENPMRQDGTAILCDGYFPGLWAIGEHNRGKPNAYPALVQVGVAKVWRDNDRDAVLDLAGPVTSDVDGLNQHKAGTDSPAVDRWSAACQVHKRSGSFSVAMDLARKQVTERGWDRFSYKLFDAEKSPVFSALFALSL